MKRFCLLVWMFGTGSVLFAQQPTGLTFSEAVKIALKNNVALNQERNIQYSAVANRSAGIGAMLPSINAGIDAYKVHGNQFIESEGKLVNGASTTNFGPSVGAQMMLFNGFNRINTYRQADNQLEAQQQQVKRTSQQVISDVATQFLQCLLDQEVVRIDRQDLEYQQKLLEQIRAQVLLGSRAPVDEYNQQAAYKASELAVKRAQFTLRNDKSILAQSLQLDPSQNFELREPSWPVDTTAIDSTRLGDLFDTALTNRGDYQGQKNLTLSNKFAWSAAKTGGLPSLFLFGNYNSFYSTASTPSFHEQIDQSNRFSYGLSLNIPIFTGLQNYNRTVRAKVLYENSKLASDNLELQVKSDVIRAYQNRKDAIINYGVANSQLDAATKAFDYESERYRLGIINFVDLSNANKAFVKAQTDFAQAAYSLKFQEVLFNYALGTLTADNMQ